jgi:hypothetical protein
LFRAETRRGTAGFYHLAQSDDGPWWLLDPAGNPAWCKAVHGVRAAGGQGDTALPQDSAARLTTWGFNAVGVSGDATGREDGLPFLATVDFCGPGPTLLGPGLRLPDVFDPQWPARAQARAQEVCGALTDEPQLIGWVTDDLPGWAQPGMEPRPSLLQQCLSLEPAFAAYHAAWEFTLALHGGKLDAMARAWGMTLPNREVVRGLTRAEIGIATRGYGRDNARWSREVARRYFTVTSAAIRAADPRHLVLGCRFGGRAGDAVLSECAYPTIDLPMPDWREIAPAVPGAPLNPVLAGDVCWAEDEFWRAPPGDAGAARRLTSVERMLRRGRLALDRAARHPAIVGYVWRQWQDEPGEQPPFARGLVHLNDAAAREHTELLTAFNLRAESVRRAAAPRR